MGAASEVPDTAARIKPATATANAFRNICVLPSLAALGGIGASALTSTNLNQFRQARKADGASCSGAIAKPH